MAKVVVTKSKLDSLAQHINTKAGTTGAKTIAQMQETVDGITGITQWNEKFTKILSPGTSETTAAITVKALCYYDGYWYGAGNDSAGDVYKLYGAAAETLTAVKLANNRTYPVKGITCDGTRVWMCCEPGGYQGRTVIYQSIADFKKALSTYSYSIQNLADYSCADICRINETQAGYGSIVCVVGRSGDGGFLCQYANGASGESLQIADAVGGFTSCCAWAFDIYGMHMERIACVSEEGYVCTGVGPEPSNWSGIQRDYLRGAKMVRSMNGSLFVACVRSDGTYLYWYGAACSPKDSPPTGSIKICDEALTILGMSYAGGLYAVVGVNGDGVTKVLQSDNQFLTGIYGQAITLPSGYTPRAMATDGSNICILADNGTNVVKAMSTIE